LQPIPKRFDGRRWEIEQRAVVLVESKAWVLVRRADSPTAMPYVVSRKEWDKFPAQGIEAATAGETSTQIEGSTEGKSPVAKPCAPKEVHPPIKQVKQ
jgi:hypothetical protein